MKSISRRAFINVAGILGGAVLNSPFLRGKKDLQTEIFQSWYLKVQARNCRTRVDAEAQLHAANLAGIDAIIYSVHFEGAHYNSAFYPWCPSIESGFDPLGYLVQRGYELGISIYAWMCPGVDCVNFDPIWNMAGKYGAPLTARWLDYSVPAARKRVRDVAADITNKYAVGILLDYIRYKVYRNFEPRYHPELSAQDITTTVSMVQEAITPYQLIATVTAHDYKSVLQDWFSWLRLGIVDTALPMAYAYQPGQIPYWISLWDTDIPLDKIVPCLSLYDLHKNPYMIKTTTELMIEINECKLLNLANSGLAFFDSDGLNSNNRVLIRSLKFKNRNNKLNIPI